MMAVVHCNGSTTKTDSRGTEIYKHDQQIKALINLPNLVRGQ